MHLRHENPLTKLFALAGLFWLIILIGLTPADYLTRDRLSLGVGISAVRPSADVPWRTHRKDTLIAAREQHPFQKPAPLVVEKVFIPFVFHKLGDDHSDPASGILSGNVENELHH